jgi:hypothetical protein
MSIIGGTSSGLRGIARIPLKPGDHGWNIIRKNFNLLAGAANFVLGPGLKLNNDGKIITTFNDPLLLKGDIWGFSTTDARIPVGTDGQLLKADSTQALGVKWATSLTSPLNTKGDLWCWSSTDARLPVGTDGQILSADSTQATGLKWIANPGGGSLSWVKVSKAYTDFNFADTGPHDIECYSLAGASVIHATKIKTSTSWTGGSMGSFTFRVGIAASLGQLISTGYNAQTAVSSSNLTVSNYIGGYDESAATSIRLAATGDGAHNFSALTQGGVDIWFLVSTGS